MVRLMIDDTSYAYYILNFGHCWSSLEEAGPPGTRKGLGKKHISPDPKPVWTVKADDVLVITNYKY